MEGPYREPRPLTDVIAPDRRRQRTIALVVGGMLVGAVLFEGARSFLGPDVPSHVSVPLPSVAPEPGHVSAAAIEAVIAKQRSTVNERCWQASTEAKDRRASAKATLTIVIGQAGDVVSSTATGDDARVASCIERQAWAWTFPAHEERSPSVQVPFVFLRQ